LEVGTIVCSGAGHDKGGFFVVLSTDGLRAEIADGKRRKLEKPKTKNVIHLKPTNRIVGSDCFKTDAAIRKLLWEYNYKQTQTGQEVD